MLVLTLLLSLCAHADDSAANVAKSAPAPAPRGGLEKSAIDEGVKKEVPKLAKCYDDNTADSESKTVVGPVSTRFSIGSDGKVTNAEILNSALKNEKVETCLVGVLKGMTFPPPAGGGTVQVDYPFYFSPDKTTAKKKKKARP